MYGGWPVHQLSSLRHNIFACDHNSDKPAAKSRFKFVTTIDHFRHTIITRSYHRSDTAYIKRPILNPIISLNVNKFDHLGFQPPMASYNPHTAIVSRGRCRTRSTPSLFVSWNAHQRPIDGPDGRRLVRFLYLPGVWVSDINEGA